MDRDRRSLYSLISVASLGLAWQLAATSVVDPFFLPPLSAVLAGAAELVADGTLPTYLAVSMGRILVGWLVGCLVAVPIGLLVGSSPLVKSVVDPYIHFFRFIPAIALVTLFIVWFGIGETSKVALIVYATGFIVMINTATGVAAIPADKLNAARLLGANPYQLFWFVTIPATVPFIYVGMRLAMASSFLVIVAAEMLAANSGLGYLVWTSRLFFRIDWMFAAILTIGLAGYLTDRAWRLVGGTLLRRYLRETARY